MKILKILFTVILSSLLLTGTVFATNSQVESIHENYSFGGFVVVIQGLTSTEIEFEFQHQKEEIVVVTILALNLEPVYQKVFNTDKVDLSNLTLPAGNYQLVVQVGDTVKSLIIKH